MHILLVGNGNMAKAVLDVCQSSDHIAITQFGQDFASEEKPVAIHFGSGRELMTLIDFCEEEQVPIIQGSTKLTTPIPTDRNVTIINAPNLSLPMIRFIIAFPDFAQKIEDAMQISVIESHQKTKKDISGTARKIMKALDIPEAEIKSVRDEDIQLAIGIPREHLDGHAYHDFIFTGQGVEIKVSTKIRGRTTYVVGALALADILAYDQPLKNGIHDLEDVMHLI